MFNVDLGKGAKMPKKCSKKCGLLKKGAISLSEKKTKGEVWQKTTLFTALIGTLPLMADNFFPNFTNNLFEFSETP